MTACHQLKTLFSWKKKEVKVQFKYTDITFNFLNFKAPKNKGWRDSLVMKSSSWSCEDPAP